MRHLLLLLCAAALVCAVSASPHSPHVTRAHGASNWGNPVPDPSAVVVAPAGRAQFTVLTASIIRMQYDEEGDFSDQDVQTYTVLNRRLPVPEFSSSVDGEGALTITTSSLTLRYASSIGGSFSAANLQVVVNNADGLGNNYTWVAGQGQDQIGNLKGTVRTLDGSNGTNTPLDCDLNMDGFSHCSWGVIGAKGFAVIDDTGAPAFDAPSPDTDWPWLRSRPNEPVNEGLCTADLSLRRQCGFNGIMWDECGRRGCCYRNSTADEGAPFCFYSEQASLDLMFFGHGLNFKQALLEFTQIAGKIPVPPRYLFGVYFSRYWAYADYEEYGLVQDYVDHQLPLDILVTDMDWHDTFYSQADAGVLDQAGQQIGWTGFTFDQHLFPNHTEFFLWCKAHNLRNTLNVHPASGIQPWEEKFEAMALAMGQDPADGRYVPYNATDPVYNTNWMKLVMAPLEAAGVDLWWLDWQQGESWIEQSRLNPTQMLNYVFYSNPNHWAVNGRRPAILHRWGGIGNHRYQVGFSGDVIPSWSALAWQPYFTATAANVGYGWWSHDLGGHTEQPAPDLYTRWIQFGALSPVFRTHCTKDGSNDRRIWMFPNENYRIMRTFTRLRAALVPYIADHALTTYDTGLSLLLPLYYQWPLSPEAYPDSGLSSTTYLYGSSLLASPIVTAVDNDTALAFKTIWIPEGRWVGFFSGDVLEGPMTVEINATLAEMPLWAVAGSIIPLRPLPSMAAPGGALLGSAQNLPSTVQLLTFVGGQTSGNLVLREDAGDDLQYQSGVYAVTQASFELSGAGNQTVLYTIAQQSVFPGFMSERSYEVHLRGVYAATSVSLDGGATTLPFQPFWASEMQMLGKNSWSYDGPTTTLQIHLRVPVPTTAGNKVQILVQLADSPNCPLLNAAVGFPARLARLQYWKAQLDLLWRTPSMVYQDLYLNFMLASETGSRINSAPLNAMPELKQFDESMVLACEEMQNIQCHQTCNPGLVEMVTAQLNC